MTWTAYFSMCKHKLRWETVYKGFKFFKDVLFEDFREAVGILIGLWFSTFWEKRLLLISVSTILVKCESVMFAESFEILGGILSRPVLFLDLCPW